MKGVFRVMYTFFSALLASSMKKTRAKGVSPMISGVMYVAVSLAAITMVVQVGNPIVRDVQDSISLDQAKEMMSRLDNTIREVAAEGKGSVRIVPIEFSRGKLVVDDVSNQIYYQLETQSEVISPGVRREIGNIYVASSTDVSVTKDATHWILENSHIRAKIKRIGSETSPAPVNLTNVIESVRYNLGEPEEADFNGQIELGVDSSAARSVGNGYTVALKEGTGLASGTVQIHVDNSQMTYDVFVTLRGGDFLEVTANNFVDK
jgi:hypothetical protein